MWGFVGKALTQFDVVFADPPYDMAKLEVLPEAVRKAQLVVPGGWFILEHGERMDVSDQPGFVLMRKYGHVRFSLFTFE